MLPPGCRIRFTRLTDSDIVTTHPAYLCCTILSVGAAGDYIDVYEGRDASSGRKVFRLEALANRSVPFNIVHPALCERGIYVSFSTTGNEATIFWVAADDVMRQEEI